MTDSRQTLEDGEFNIEPGDQAGKSRQETWLLAGASKSGKTYFLSAAHDAQIEVEAKRTIPGIKNFNFKYGRDQRLKLATVQEQILKEGVLSATEGNDLLRYVFKMEIELDGSVSAASLPGNGSDATLSNLPETQIVLLDGPGGGMFPSVDAVTASTRDDLQEFSQAFQAAAFEATGILLFLPTKKRSKEAEYHEREEIIAFLTDVWEGKFRKIERIAVCLSKYEVMFLNKGNQAETMAKDSSRIEEVWREVDGGFRILESLNDCWLKQNIDVRIFPVSAFGFVGETGFPNVVEQNVRGHNLQLPMVLVPQPDVRVGKLEVPLYPRPFPAHDVDTLHKSFNLAAPMIFLASGYTAEGTFLQKDVADLHGRLVTSVSSEFHNEDQVQPQ